MSSLLDTTRVSIPLSIQLFLFTVVGWGLYALYTNWATTRPYPDFPIASIDGLSPQRSWQLKGMELVKDGLKRYPKGFQVITGTGPKIVLQNKFAEELKNNPDLNFPKAFSSDFFTNYPGFEAHRVGLTNDSFIQDTVRIKLTQSLNLITDDLIDETTESLHDILGENKEWHVTSMKEDALDIVARLSARVFLGLPLCRDPRWLEISKSYTVDSFMGSYILRTMSPFTRPFRHWFIPQMKSLRRAVKDAHTLMNVEVDRRKARVVKAREAGEKPPKTADAIGWMFEVAKGKDVDLVAGQLSLSLAAIHTTSETTSAAIMHLCQFPAVVPRLREEVIRVVGENGWSKNTLYKLRLMDSFIKESQRVNPMSTVSMNRYVEKAVTLSDGTILPKGSRIMVAARYMDPAVYADPHHFSAERFLEKRETPGQDGMWQLVATSPEHTLFGHGQHACPGRFFAANEIKILLAHLLLKYDFRFVNGVQQEYLMQNTGYSINPNLKVEIRRRKEEIGMDLESATTVV